MTTAGSWPPSTHPPSLPKGPEGPRKKEEAAKAEVPVPAEGPVKNKAEDSATKINTVSGFAWDLLSNMMSSVDQLSKYFMGGAEVAEAAPLTTTEHPTTLEGGEAGETKGAHPEAVMSKEKSEALKLKSVAIRGGGGFAAGFFGELIFGSKTKAEQVEQIVKTLGEVGKNVEKETIEIVAKRLAADKKLAAEVDDALQKLIELAHKLDPDTQEARSISPERRVQLRHALMIQGDGGLVSKLAFLISKCLISEREESIGKAHKPSGESGKAKWEREAKETVAAYKHDISEAGEQEAKESREALEKRLELAEQSTKDIRDIKTSRAEDTLKAGVRGMGLGVLDETAKWSITSALNSLGMMLNTLPAPVRAGVLVPAMTATIVGAAETEISPAATAMRGFDVQGNPIEDKIMANAKRINNLLMGGIGQTAFMLAFPQSKLMGFGVGIVFQALVSMKFPIETSEKEYKQHARVFLASLKKVSMQPATNDLVMTIRTIAGRYPDPNVRQELMKLADQLATEGKSAEAQVLRETALKEEKELSREDQLLMEVFKFIASLLILHMLSEAAALGKGIQPKTTATPEATATPETTATPAGAGARVRDIVQFEADRLAFEEEFYNALNEAMEEEPQIEFTEDYMKYFFRDAGYRRDQTFKLEGQFWEKLAKYKKEHPEFAQDIPEIVRSIKSISIQARDAIGQQKTNVTQAKRKALQELREQQRGTRVKEKRPTIQPERVSHDVSAKEQKKRMKEAKWTPKTIGIPDDMRAQADAMLGGVDLKALGREAVKMQEQMETHKFTRADPRVARTEVQTDAMRNKILKGLDRKEKQMAIKEANKLMKTHGFSSLKSPSLHKPRRVRVPQASKVIRAHARIKGVKGVRF